MQLVHDPSQSSVDNLHNVKLEASRHLMKKEKEYLKTKIEELETDGKIINIRDFYRGINDFKTCYKPRTYIVKDANGDLVAD